MGLGRLGTAGEGSKGERSNKGLVLDRDGIGQVEELLTETGERGQRRKKRGMPRRERSKMEQDRKKDQNNKVDRQKRQTDWQTDIQTDIQQVQWYNCLANTEIPKHGKTVG